ncbi:MAG: ImmA/IrrE family metallo-endopeptidase, partial [Eubacterium sp.]
QTAINLGNKVDTDPFNSTLLKSYLEEIRHMTNQNPALFTERLYEILSECGVALVILPHLKNARINGAVKWLSIDKAVLAINVYGAFADKFWFTLFHELKHVLQHKTKDTFLSYTSSTTISEIDDQLEKEADDFAQAKLLPRTAYESFKKNGTFSAEAVLCFSRQIDIHPGIVVGRLQHDNLIEYFHLNHLKVKYQIIDTI